MDKRWATIPAIWIVTILLIQIIGFILAPSQSEIPDSCPENSNNCHHVIVMMEGAPEDVHQNTLDWIESESRAGTISEKNLTSHSVFRTPGLFFPDDFFVETKCENGQSWIEIHSESRIGWGDYGVNQERVEELLEHLDSVEMDGHQC